MGLTQISHGRGAVLVGPGRIVATVTYRQEPTMTDPLMSLEDIAQHLGVHKRTVERLRASDPTFPPPVPLSKRTLRWRPQRIHAWVAQREAASEAPPRRRRNAAGLQR